VATPKCSWNCSLALDSLPPIQSNVLPMWGQHMVQLCSLPFHSTHCHLYRVMFYRIQSNVLTHEVKVVRPTHGELRTVVWYSTHCHLNRVMFYRCRVNRMVQLCSLPLDSLPPIQSNVSSHIQSNVLAHKGKVVKPTIGEVRTLIRHSTDCHLC
jgi:hypothetical protein